MKMNLLTMRKVDQLRRKPGKYLDGAGLYLEVTERGAFWLLRYTLNGRTRDMGLGSADLVSLAEARDDRDCYRKLLKRGIDPIEHRRAKLVQDAARAITFERCSRDYIEIHRDEWGPKHAGAWEQSLEDYAFPKIGHEPVGSINVDHVVTVLSPIWREIPTTATRLRGRIQIILDYAAACEYRSNRDGNPADWNGPLHLRLADLDKIRKPTHYPAVPFERIPEFMAALREENGDRARALEFQILSVARPEEVIGAKRDQTHGDLWITPAEEMKVDERTSDPRFAETEDCIRPLSDPARAIVNQMIKANNEANIFSAAKLTGISRSTLCGRNYQRFCAASDIRTRHRTGSGRRSTPGGKNAPRFRRRCWI